MFRVFDLLLVEGLAEYVGRMKFQSFLLQVNFFPFIFVIYRRRRRNILFCPTSLELSNIFIESIAEEVVYVSPILKPRKCHFCRNLAFRGPPLSTFGFTM